MTKKKVVNCIQELVKQPIMLDYEDEQEPSDCEDDFEVCDGWAGRTDDWIEYEGAE